MFVCMIHEEGPMHSGYGQIYLLEGDELVDQVITCNPEYAKRVCDLLNRHGMVDADMTEFTLPPPVLRQPDHEQSDPEVHA